MSFVRLLGIMVGFGLLAAACSDAKGRGGGGGGDDDDDNGSSSPEGSGGPGDSGDSSGSSGEPSGSSGDPGATSGGSCTACGEECGFWACNCPNGDVVNAVACVNDCCLSQDEACAGACDEPEPECVGVRGSCDFDSDCCSDFCNDGFCG